MMRTKTLMPDEPKDLQYPSNSLYYSGPSKMIETHITKKREMKDEDWVDSIRPSGKHPMYMNYRDLDDQALEDVIKDVRKEWDRRQREKYDRALERNRL